MSEAEDAVNLLASETRERHMTRMLSGLCEQFDNPTELKDGPVMPSINLVPGLHEWWAAHKATKAVREAEAKDRREVRLAKRLTAEALRSGGLVLKEGTEDQHFIRAVAIQIADRLELEARGG